MHKIVCQGCGDIFMSNTQEENNKWMKLHWDYQYPSHAKCKFCDTTIHDNDDDSVKKRLFEHEEKICEEAKRRIHPTMHKIVCQAGGCEVIFVSNTQEENNKWMKLHWDYQYPSHAKCEFCDTIFHDNDDDSVKKKLFEHEEKICKEAKRRKHQTMQKIVCQGCGDIFMSYTQEENNKLMKLHWDYQYPSHTKCEFCDIIFHDNDDDSVKKRLFEHMEKICKEAKHLFACKNVTKQDCNKFFITTDKNLPDPKQLKKHLKEKHEIENAIACKSIFGIHGCDYWFMANLDSDGDEDYDDEEMDKHYAGPAHYKKIKKRK